MVSGPVEEPPWSADHPLIFKNDGPHFSKCLPVLCVSLSVSAFNYRLLVISFCEVDVGAVVYPQSLGCVDSSALWSGGFYTCFSLSYIDL